MGEGRAILLKVDVGDVQVYVSIAGDVEPKQWSADMALCFAENGGSMEFFIGVKRSNVDHPKEHRAVCAVSVVGITHSCTTMPNDHR